MGGHLDVTYGNYGRQNARATVNIPLIDNTLYTRVTLASTRRDGLYENVIDGTAWNDEDRLAGIVQVRWDASEDLVADLLVSATKTRQTPRGQKCEFFGPEFGFNGKAPLEAIYDSEAAVTAQQECENSGINLELDEFRSELNAQSDIFEQGRYEVDTNLAGLTLSWGLGEALGFEDLNIKSITGFRRTQLSADEDLDGSSAGLTGRVAPEDNVTDQYSQEFQFIGTAMDGRMNVTLGLYAFQEKTDDDWLQSYAGLVEGSSQPNSLLLAQSQLTERKTENEAWAVFSQVGFDITENLELTLGLRYTDETRRTDYQEAEVYLPSIGNGDFCPGGGCSTKIGSGQLHLFSASGFTPFNSWQYGFDANANGNLELRELGNFGQDSAERSDDDWTPSVSLKYLVDDGLRDLLSIDDGMIFFTYSEGFRSGGVVVANGDFDNNGLKDMSQFEPEYVKNYEIGLKLEAFDKTLRANFATFFTDYEDIQVTAIVPDRIGIPLPAVENAGKAEIKGAEAEITYVPFDSLRFTTSIAYTDGDYLEYSVDTADLVGNVTVVDRSDEPMPRIAPWTAFLAVDYFIFTDNWGTFAPSVNVRYTDKIYGGFDRAGFLVADEVTSPETHFVDVRLTWSLPDDRTTIAFWGKNVENNDDYTNGGVPLISVNRSTGTVYADPRTYGVDISYVFGD
ncbi:TonB-dependent receptor [Oceanicoccus sp. KOV_DT_Chl]|uniref:TonB-dependent receptor n=1 Tax=Oceanicoccus sp. KOV_DT_Chl TaxID=1904639 RepID=UPI00135A3AC5|nr:TonB-dependent receptor [Oceanicoccus sp. KOV_DT_Chl]